MINEKLVRSMLKRGKFNSKIHADASKFSCNYNLPIMSLVTLFVCYVQWLESELQLFLTNWMTLAFATEELIK